MKRFVLLGVGIIAATSVVLTSCRGQRSSVPAVHLNPNMDHQPRFNPQTGEWGLPEGTVARSSVARPDAILDTRGVFATGLVEGSPVGRNPLPMSSNLIRRGQERFNIHCAVCHGRDGLGQTPLLARGLPPPPPLGQARLVAMKEGELFQIITHGVRNMAPLGQQILPEDRWAILSWVRVLQAREGGTARDLPPERLNELKKQP